MFNGYLKLKEGIVYEGQFRPNQDEVFGFDQHWTFHRLLSRPCEVRVHGHYSKISPELEVEYLKHQYFDWLVVDLPLWKIWVRQLGWLLPIYGYIWKIENLPYHQPVFFPVQKVAVRQPLGQALVLQKGTLWGPHFTVLSGNTVRHEHALQYTWGKWFAIDLLS